jgi:hypothetical protein
MESGLKRLSELDGRGKMVALAALASMDELKVLDVNEKNAALLELPVWAFSDCMELDGEKLLEKQYPGFYGIVEKLDSGVIDEFQAAIEFRKTGAFGVGFGGEIDSWGGVPPGPDAVGYMVELLRAMAG